MTAETSTDTPAPPIAAHLVIRGANDAVGYYERALGAKPSQLVRTPDGTLMHGSMLLPNGGIFYLMEAREEPVAGPPRVVVHLEVPDVDASWKRALQAGGKVIMDLADQFWGDRYGMFIDPFGQAWSMSTHTRDVPPEELEKAAREMKY